MYKKFNNRSDVIVICYPIKSLLGLILGVYIYPIYPRRYAPVVNDVSINLFLKISTGIPE